MKHVGSIGAAAWLNKHFHVDEEQARNMVEDEAREIEKEAREDEGRTCGYVAAIDRAADRIAMWLGQAAPAEYPENTDKMPAFIAAHRRAYVWAAFARRSCCRGIPPRN